MPLYLKALTAEELLTKFCAVAPLIFPNRNVALTITTHVEGLRVQTADAPVSALDSNAGTVAFRIAATGKPYLFAASASLRDSAGNRQFSYSSGDQISATMEFGGPPSAEEAATWLTVMRDHFDFAPVAAVVGAAATASESAALQIRERAAGDLHAAVAKLTDALAQLSIQDAEARRRLQEELEKNYLERSTQLDANYVNKQNALDEEREKNRAAADKREADHVAHVAAFNTNEAIYVRRAQADTLTEILRAESEKLTLSKETGQKRGWVHAFTWLMLLSSGALAAAMASKVLDENQLVPNHSVPLLGATVTFFATLVYYLKWNDSWFRQHAEGELASRRYRADMMRASWLAELVSERSKADQAPWPHEILEALTRNLFRDVTPMSQTEHPLEQLTSLMKRAKEINIGSGRLSLKADSEKSDKA